MPSKYGFDKERITIGWGSILSILPEKSTESITDNVKTEVKAKGFGGVFLQNHAKTVLFTLYFNN